MLRTIRQKLFVYYFLGQAQGNATLAARLAGYRCAHEVSARLLANAGIQEAIEAKLASFVMASEEVMLRLSDKASSTMEDFVSVDEDGMPYVDLKKGAKRHKFANVKKLKLQVVNQGEGKEPKSSIIDFELYDPIPALSMLAKFQGLDGPPSKIVHAEPPPEIPEEQIPLPGESAKFKELAVKHALDLLKIPNARPVDDK